MDDVGASMCQKVDENMPPMLGDVTPIVMESLNMFFRAAFSIGMHVYLTSFYILQCIVGYLANKTPYKGHAARYTGDRI